MKLNKLTFRDVDQKWVAIDSKKDIKFISKKIKHEFEESPILGYMYIDHDKGIFIKIVGNVIKDFGKYYLEEDLIDIDTSIKITDHINFDVTILENNVIESIKFTDQIINQFNELYNKKAIVESRRIENIDDFRHDDYIDDVELLLTHKNKKSERIWGRIEDCSKENLVFVCTLLGSSKYNKNYKEGTMVLVKLEQDKKETNLKINSIVQKIEK